MYRAIINGLFNVSFGHRCEAGWTDAVTGFAIHRPAAKNSGVGHAPTCACCAARAVKNGLATGAGFIHHSNIQLKKHYNMLTYFNFNSS